MLPEIPLALKKKTMLRCLKLAEKGKYFVKSNPMVGAVLLSAEGKILLEGYHRAFGEEHAENNLLKKIEKAPANSSLFVNLEPCCHQGINPPCTQIIIKKKVPRVIVGTEDPQEKICGKGILELRKNSIAVEVGVCQKECELFNQKYLVRVKKKKTFVALKIASSLDGKIALSSGVSQWITGKDSRKKVHQIRSSYDAVAVGKNTLVQDNPKLNNRYFSLPEIPQPQPVLFLGKGELPESSHFLQEKERKKFLLAGKNVSSRYLSRLEKKNCIVFQSKKDLPTIEESLEFLYQQRIYSLLVEGGGELFTSFLRTKLVDKIYLFLAPRIIGSEGKNWCGDLSLKELKKNWQLEKKKQFGSDILLEWSFLDALQ